MDGLSPVSFSLLRTACMVKALVFATTIARAVDTTGGDALVGDAADVRAGSGATTVSHGTSTTAQHTPALSSAERNPPTVSVQTNALEAFWR